MNVLIIDDQPDVVAGIHSGINWDALSIRQVFCANDIIRAREILSNNSVDIMPVSYTHLTLPTTPYV